MKLVTCSKYPLVSNNCTEHGAESVFLKLPGPATVVNIKCDDVIDRYINYQNFDYIFLFWKFK